MTTYHFRGTGFGWNTETHAISALGTASLHLITSDDYALSWRYTSTARTALDSQILPGAGDHFGLRIDGVDRGLQPAPMIYDLKWGTGRSTTLLELSYASATDSERIFLFELGGAPLPRFGSLQAFRDFAGESVSGAFRVSSGSGLGPGRLIDPTKFAAFSTISEHDTLHAPKGDDAWGARHIDTGRGNDLVYADASGNDLALGRGNDTAWGYAGADTITGDAGHDLIFGGSGHDRIYGGAGGDKLHGMQSNDLIEGGEGHDMLFGGDGQDTLRGGLHEDDLRGGAGDDWLYGGQGRDTLRGGTGDDQLFGGTARDHFLFIADTGKTTIGDFEPGIDRIGIRGYSDPARFARQSGTDTLFDFGKGDLLVVTDTTRAEALGALFLL